MTTKQMCLSVCPPVHLFVSLLFHLSDVCVSVSRCWLSVYMFVACVSPVVSSLYLVMIDAQAVDLTPSQDTSVPTRNEDQYVVFNTKVEIQQYLEKLPRSKVVICSNILVMILDPLQMQLCSLNSNITSPKRSWPARSALPLWRWMRSNQALPA